MVLFINIFTNLLYSIDLQMNNIIKHINYEEFTEVLGSQSLDDFLKKTQGYACIFFIAEWSVPSRLTFKRIKKMYLNKKNIAFIDVDLVDNI
jgi:hypothetical protein